MKATKIIYWVTTIIFFLFEGVMPAIYGNSALAKEGFAHLGYPEYFRILLTIFKISGALVLILPFFKGRIKEWAYAGFTFNLISAAVSHAAVDGLSNGQTFFPVVVMLILAISYFTYHRIYGVPSRH
ncbi:DoxX family protein [Chitinophaga silvisoli]|uniref:DoxX family protein n=1 Tax=Chitinophaga silvisoli TaxID=2291814 RepID=A0A3E1P3K4_9BACT|nr:DoxX family protein [Chitinophaga silvisoli]RFM34751.1 DoxX family protein [Chitinophaga silvisoli]